MSEFETRVCGGEVDVLESEEIAEVHASIYPSEVAGLSPLIKVKCFAQPRTVVKTNHSITKPRLFGFTIKEAHLGSVRYL